MIFNIIIFGDIIFFNFQPSASNFQKFFSTIKQFFETKYHAYVKEPILNRFLFLQ